MVAEGAVDLAAEPELELYDMAALDIIVREAGGTFTSLDGAAGPFGGNALASNGHLHEAALGFLGSAAVNEGLRSEEHTSELQSLMRISYAVFCLKKKKNTHINTNKMICNMKYS